MNRLLREIEVLYEDEHVLAVAKPARLLTLPDRFSADKPNVLHWLQQRYPSVFVVHRLDRETSGVLLFARTPEAHARLSRDFEQRKVEKIYFALVTGRVLPAEGTVDRPIIPHPAGDGRMTTAPKGKPSLSHYKVLRQFRSYAWLEVRIETGRTHQIRVHMAWLGHPLAVDPLYGGGEGVYLSAFKEHYRPSRDHEELPLIDRVPLHAGILVCRHPSEDRELRLEAPLPKDLQAVLRQLERWG